MDQDRKTNAPASNRAESGRIKDDQSQRSLAARKQSNVSGR